VHVRKVVASDPTFHVPQVAKLLELEHGTNMGMVVAFLYHNSPCE
jgi:hypothetical protein